MNAVSKDLLELNEARMEVLRLMNEYCYRIDRGDVEGFAALFDNGSFGIIGDPTGPITADRKAMLAMLQNVTLYDGKPHTKHVMSNIQIDIAASGTEAKAESYIIVFQALPDFPMQAIFGGHYLDRFSKKGQNWEFASREISPDLIGDLSRHRADMA